MFQAASQERDSFATLGSSCGHYARVERSPTADARRAVCGVKGSRSSCRRPVTLQPWQNRPVACEEDLAGGSWTEVQPTCTEMRRTAPAPEWSQAGGGAGWSQPAAIAWELHGLGGDAAYLAPIGVSPAHGNSGIGEARAGLEAAIRELLVSAGGPMQSPPDLEPRTLQPPQAPTLRSSHPTPMALPMYANASATPNYRARPDVAIAELLSLRRLLADRLSGKGVGAKSTLPSSWSGTGFGREELSAEETSYFPGEAYFGGRLVDEPWHVL